jgi:hypothetical protein
LPAADLATQIQGYVENTTAGRLLTAAVVWNQNRDDATARKVIVSIDHRNLERDEHWLLATGIMCDVAFAVDDRAVMTELYEALNPYSDLMLVHDLLRSCSGSVESCLGELATGLRRYDKAIGHYERSITKEESAVAEPKVTTNAPETSRRPSKTGPRALTAVITTSSWPKSTPAWDTNSLLFSVSWSDFLSSGKPHVCVGISRAIEPMLGLERAAQPRQRRKS